MLKFHHWLVHLLTQASRPQNIVILFKSTDGALSRYCPVYLWMEVAVKFFYQSLLTGDIPTCGVRTLLMCTCFYQIRCLFGQSIIPTWLISMLHLQGKLAQYLRDAHSKDKYHLKEWHGQELDMPCICSIQHTCKLRQVQLLRIPHILHTQLVSLALWLGRSPSMPRTIVSLNSINAPLVRVRRIRMTWYGIGLTLSNLYGELAFCDGILKSPNIVVNTKWRLFKDWFWLLWNLVISTWWMWSD